MLYSVQGDIGQGWIYNFDSNEDVILFRDVLVMTAKRNQQEYDYPTRQEVCKSFHQVLRMFDVEVSDKV